MYTKTIRAIIAPTTLERENKVMEFKTHFSVSNVFVVNGMLGSSF